jgi:hypothetical protein
MPQVFQQTLWIACAAEKEGQEIAATTLDTEPGRNRSARVFLTHCSSQMLPRDRRSTTRVAKMTNNLQSNLVRRKGIIESDAIIIGADVSGFAAFTISAALEIPLTVTASALLTSTWRPPRSLSFEAR